MDDTSHNSPTKFSLTSIFGGSGNVTTASVDGEPIAEGVITIGVKSVTLTAGGSGYTDLPTVTITGGGGTGASAYAVIGNGTVLNVFLLAVGVGYTSAPMINITGGGGTGASATAVIGTSGDKQISGRVWQWTVTPDP